MFGNIRGIVQHFVFKPWPHESLVFIERGSVLASSTPTERWFLRVWEPAASEAARPRPQPGMCLQRWKAKAVRERREGITWRENSAYKVATDVQNNKQGEEQRNMFLIFFFLKEAHRMEVKFIKMKMCNLHYM